MRKIVFVILAAVAICGFTVRPIVASTDNKIRSFVYTHNTSDTWVWVTTYGMPVTGKPPSDSKATAVANALAMSAVTAGMKLGAATIQGAWCVAPGALDKHGLTAMIVHVRFEVTRANCAHPVLLDKTLKFDGIDLPGQPQHLAKPGLATLSGKSGAYTLTEVQGSGL